MEHGAYVSGVDQGFFEVEDNTLLYGNLQAENIGDVGYIEFDALFVACAIVSAVLVMYLYLLADPVNVVVTRNAHDNFRLCILCPLEEIQMLQSEWVLAIRISECELDVEYAFP